MNFSNILVILSSILIFQCSAKAQYTYPIFDTSDVHSDYESDDSSSGERDDLICARPYLKALKDQGIQIKAEKLTNMVYWSDNAVTNQRKAFYDSLQQQFTIKIGDDVVKVLTGGSAETEIQKNLVAVINVTNDKQNTLVALSRDSSGQNHVRSFSMPKAAGFTKIMNLIEAHHQELDYKNWGGINGEWGEGPGETFLTRAPFMTIGLCHIKSPKGSSSPDTEQMQKYIDLVKARIEAGLCNVDLNLSDRQMKDSLVSALHSNYSLDVKRPFYVRDEDIVGAQEIWKQVNVQDYNDGTKLIDPNNNTETARALNVVSSLLNNKYFKGLITAENDHLSGLTYGGDGHCDDLPIELRNLNASPAKAMHQLGSK